MKSKYYQNIQEFLDTQYDNYVLSIRTVYNIRSGHIGTSDAIFWVLRDRRSVWLLVLGAHLVKK